MSLWLYGNEALQQLSIIPTSQPSLDLRGVPDHLFSHNDFTFFGDFIGKTFKLHPNTECCVRLEVACLLFVLNLENSLLVSISSFVQGLLSMLAIHSFHHSAMDARNGETHTRLAPKINRSRKNYRMNNTKRI